MADDWTGVRERVVELAGRPGAAEVFGARYHGWRLEEPLSAAELAEVERRLRLDLPAGYRSFLLEVGAGGAGPAYGLFPLRQVDGAWRWEGDGADMTDLDTLHRPFPRVDAFNPAEGLPDPPDEEAYDTTEAFNAAEDAYWEHHESVVNAPEHSTGLLYLCHLGCAYREALVVTGPARGQMWADDTAGDGGFSPLLDADGNRIDFPRWYHQWLDAATTRLDGTPAPTT